MKIGFVGQGWIGKNYADDFENRGYDVVRYALEEPYLSNREAIAGCEITLIAVPTPTTEDGFDDSYVRDALGVIGEGNIAVIKSTIIPGTTEKLQKDFPKITVFHSPEFLVEKTAAHDAANPNRNIIGIPEDTPEMREKAEKVLSTLPDAPYSKVMTVKEAEMVKYAGNCYLYSRVLFMNILYNFVEAQGADWEQVREGLVHDPRIGKSHSEPVNDGGRGAGGHCFIKDFEAFREQYKELASDERGNDLLAAYIEKNNELLVRSGKNLDLLKDVYGNLDKYK